MQYQTNLFRKYVDKLTFVLPPPPLVVVIVIGYIGLLSEDVIEEGHQVLHLIQHNALMFPRIKLINGLLTLVKFTSKHSEILNLKFSQ
jgi:hypothetical protein